MQSNDKIYHYVLPCDSFALSDDQLSFFTQDFTCYIYIYICVFCVCMCMCAYYICVYAYLGAYLQVVRPCRGHSKPIAFMHQRAHKITRVIDIVHAPYSPPPPLDRWHGPYLCENQAINLNYIRVLKPKEKQSEQALPGSAGLATEAAPKMNCKCVLGSGHCYDDYAQPKYIYYMVADMAHLGWQASAN